MTRDFTNTINWILDNIIPPIIRDSRIFTYPMFFLLFRSKTKFFFEFKQKASILTSKQTIEYYKNLSDVHIKRETDLNKKSIEFILNNIYGETVLDIACGRGYMAKQIANHQNVKVIGIDFIINENLKDSENPYFIEGSIEKIPYPDDYFDTVICSHTLEHIININESLTELRRVCNKKLIIILPRQREYKYTFDLHVHFFPYEFSVLNLMNNKNGVCLCINNDWVYYETY